MEIENPIGEAIGNDSSAPAPLLLLPGKGAGKGAIFDEDPLPYRDVRPSCEMVAVRPRKPLGLGLGLGMGVGC